jgi:DNA-binding beta-propeller fold protein YncE
MDRRLITLAGIALFALSGPLVLADHLEPEVAATFPVGQRPGAPGIDGFRGLAYVKYDHAVAVVDVRRHELRHVVEVDGRLREIGVDSLAGRAYVAEFGARGPSLAVVDGESGRVVKRIKKIGQPLAIEVNPQTGRVYVLSREPRSGSFQGFSAVVIDGRARNVPVVARVPIEPFDAFPYSVAIDRVTERAFIPGQDLQSRGMVVVIDGVTGAVVDRIPVRQRPWQAASDPLLGKIYVNHGPVGGSSGTYLTVLDGGSLTVEAEIHLGTRTEQPVANPVTGLVYVPAATDVGGQYPLYVIDGRSGTLLGNLLFQGVPMPPLINSMTNRVWVFEGSRLRIIDGDTHEVAAWAPIRGGTGQAIDERTDQVVTSHERGAVEIVRGHHPVD